MLQSIMVKEVIEPNTEVVIVYVTRNTQRIK
jgi:hypothetical protein